MQGNIIMWLEIFGGVVVLLFLAGIRIVRPTRRGLIERLGKYHHFANPGFHWIIPIVDRLYQVNITEQLVNANPQEIITNDNLNAMVDAQIYFKIKSDETSVKNSQYNVNDVSYQIVNLARTTLRNIIGTLTLKSANSERGRINDELLTLINFHHTTPAPTTISASTPDDPIIILTKHIRDLVWPRDTNVSFDIEGKTVLLDVDLPEIEDMPTVHAVVNKKELCLVFKDRSQTQRRQEYLIHIHAIAFRLLGEVFATLPPITEVILSAYSQRPDRRTGQIGDDYLLSVRVTREQWGQINFANLPAIDVVACFDLFEVRRKINKSGEFATIEPFTN